MSILSKLTRLLGAQSIALLALCLALSGTTAYAVSKTAAKNSVVSKSIKNGQVKRQDLAADSVTGDKVADATLTGDDVADESLEGTDIANGSLHGNDIDLSSLDRVPSARVASLGGTVRGVADKTCNPDTLAYVTCASVAITTQDPSTLVLTGEVRIAHQTNYLYGAQGICRFRVDGSLLAAGGGTWVEKAKEEFYAPAQLTGLSAVAPGSHTVILECNDQYYATYSNVDLTVLAVSAE
ncbi:hypothetical protein BH09ACT12_BH09ACT12_07350 [soil metagenome]